MLESQRIFTINMKSILELLFERNEPLNKIITKHVPIFYKFDIQIIPKFNLKRTMQSLISSIRESV